MPDEAALGDRAVATAQALLDRRAARAPAGPLGELAPATMDEAAAAQRALARLTGADTPAGFKVGATGARMRAFLGVDTPIPAFMAARDVHAGGVGLPFAGFRGLALECELAVTLAADLPPGPCDATTARAAVGSVHAAIELVENRYGPPPAGDLLAVGLLTSVADQFYHRAAVVGDGASPRDLAGLRGTLSIDGAEVAAGLGAELLGDPYRCLAALAGHPVAAAFGGLRRGQVVLLGSVCPPVFVTSPGSVAVAFKGLPPVAFRLT